MEGIGARWIVKNTILLISLLSVLVQANKQPSASSSVSLPQSQFPYEILSNQLRSSLPDGDIRLPRPRIPRVPRIPRIPPIPRLPNPLHRLPEWMKGTELSRCIQYAPVFCAAYTMSTSYLSTGLYMSCLAIRTVWCMRRHSVDINDCTIGCAKTMSTDFGFHIDSVEGYLETCYDRCKMIY